MNHRSDCRTVRRWVLRAFLSTVILLSSSLASNLGNDGPHSLVAGTFLSISGDGTPVGWRRTDIKGRSEFAVIEDEQMRVLRVLSSGAASGLFREVMADPKEFPIVRWSWKVSAVVTTANELQKQRDDAAARVFALFKDPLPGASAFSRFKHKLAAATGAVSPGVALCYIWSNQLDRDEAARSAYSEWVGVIAAEQGPTKAGKWITVERNLVEDFRRLFGTDPKQIVGIALMTDTDNTGESITAFYSDIVFHKRTGKPPASVSEQPLDSPSAAKPSLPRGQAPGTHK